MDNKDRERSIAFKWKKIQIPVSKLAAIPGSDQFGKLSTQQRKNLMRIR